MFAVALLALQSVGDEVVQTATGDRGALALVAGVVGVASAGFVYAVVAWRVSGYRVTAHQIELKRGVVFRSYRRLALDRVESIDTAQPVLARIMGLAEVRVEAVSQGGTELRLKYLSEEEAERVRGELEALRRHVEAPAPPSIPLLHVPVRELLIGYLAAPALVVVPVVGIAIVAAIVGRSFVALAVVLPVPVLLLLPAAARLEQIWDFRVEDAGDTFVTRRGLLNLHTQRIVTGRVQAVRVEQPLLWRPLKRFRVVVDVAGYRGARNQEGAAAATLLPVATAEAVRYLLIRLEMRIDLEALDYRPLPPRARWRSPVRWRCYSMAWTPTHSVIRSGLLWRRTEIVPHAKLQSVRLTQGPWQRRLGLATLHLDTAGVRVKAAAVHRDVTEAGTLAGQSRRYVRA